MQITKDNGMKRLLVLQLVLKTREKAMSLKKIINREIGLSQCAMWEKQQPKSRKN